MACFFGEGREHQDLLPRGRRSEPLNEPRDSLGVFKSGIGWATTQDSIPFPVWVLSETGSDHLHVIAEEVSRVAELCIGQDMGTMSTATAFTNMEADSVN
jgi:hypothetical protein